MVDISSDVGNQEKERLWIWVVMECLMEERIVRGDLAY